MTRHLLLSGGPGHAFATTSSLLDVLLADQGVQTRVVTEPADAVAVLRGAEDGTGDPVDLVTVNALRWRMDGARYAPERDRYGVALDPADLAVVDRFVRAGGGLLALHTAVICFDADPVWQALCGAVWHWGRSSHPPHGPVEVEVSAAGRSHAITHDVEGFVVEDEAYGFLEAVDDLDPLLVTSYGGRAHPLLWARTVDEGRVVTDLLGHGPASFEHPTHRRILGRAAAWATGGSTGTATAAATGTTAGTRRPT